MMRKFLSLMTREIIFLRKILCNVSLRFQVSLGAPSEASKNGIQKTFLSYYVHYDVTKLVTKFI